MQSDHARMSELVQIGSGRKRCYGGVTEQKYPSGMPEPANTGTTGFVAAHCVARGARGSQTAGANGGFWADMGIILKPSNRFRQGEEICCAIPQSFDND